jgi:hypothetical protein
MTRRRRRRRRMTRMMRMESRLTLTLTQCLMRAVCCASCHLLISSWCVSLLPCSIPWLRRREDQTVVASTQQREETITTASNASWKHDKTVEKPTTQRCTAYNNLPAATIQSNRRRRARETTKGQDAS